MSLRQAAQQALEALESVYPYTDSLICYASTTGEHPPNAIDGNVRDAINALRAALAEPQTTHWEGCEAVHPECEAAKAERQRIVDMLLDMHAKEERHNYYGFIARMIKESA